MKAKWNLIPFSLICLIVVLQAVTSGAQPVTKVAAGWFHSLFLKSDGSLWAMGGDSVGQLGDGTYSTIKRPKQVVASNVTAIAAGNVHSIFLKSDGSLWAMGWNKYGQLGDGTYGIGYPNNSTNLPEQIVASNVTAIAAGYYHSLFLKSDGSLWAMGYNGYGQLGDGTYNNTNLPEQIVTSNVTAIAAGQYHSLFLKSDGSLWVMGYNGTGQLGDGTYNNTNLPEQIATNNISAIIGGGLHSLFLKRDGSLWATGNNLFGQLGDGIYDPETNFPEQILASNITAIAAGDSYSLFVKSDGSLWAMGEEKYGQLGDGTYGVVPFYSTNLPEQIVAGSVTEIAAGGRHSLFVKSDGSLWAMGWNNDGQLGDGTTLNSNRPEQVVVNPFYDKISGQLLTTGDMQLSFVGIAGANYALDWATSLSPANWVPLATNPADAGGVLVFTNTPEIATNNFWRIRSVP